MGAVIISQGPVARLVAWRTSLVQRHNLAPSQSPGLGILQREELGEHGAALGAGGLDTCTGS